MGTKLRDLGNSKAIILPKKIVDKYHLTEVDIEETSEGILLRPITSFEMKLNKLRSNKKKIYERMEEQASEIEVLQHYENEAEELGDVDLDIFDELED